MIPTNECNWTVEMTPGVPVDWTKIARQMDPAYDRFCLVRERDEARAIADKELQRANNLEATVKTLQVQLTAASEHADRWSHMATNFEEQLADIARERRRRKKK